MRRLCAILAVSLCAAGCGTGAGGRGGPDATLRQTAAKLGDIRSGDLDFRLAVEPKRSNSDRVGWEVKGPFELGNGGRPPQFQVDYTRRRGDQEVTVTVTLSGGRAYVALGGETYEMTAARAQALTWALVGREELGELDIRGWLSDPKLSDGEDVGGDATDRIRADLDASAAIRDLLGLAEKARGGAVGSLSTADAKRLSDAVAHATAEVLTGKDDRLLRRLRVYLDLGPDVPGALRGALGSVVGGEVDLELTIEHPNQAISIHAPLDAHPTSEFPGG